MRALVATMSFRNDSNVTNDLFANHYSSIHGTLVIVVVTVISLVIISGNFLTILAVARERRLQQLQNWFIVSLAVSDFLVGLLVMPLSLTYALLDKRALPQIVCELWLALDVLLVTASILNLCVISLDRYWSVVDPFEYMRKRTKTRVGLMIAAAWLVALLISFPPLVGWNEPPKDRSQSSVQMCAVSKRLDYVLYSSCGSFFVPSVLLVIVYLRIYQVKHRRAKKLLSRSSVGMSKNLPTAGIQRQTSNCELLTTVDKQKIVEMKPIQKPKLASVDCEIGKNAEIHQSYPESVAEKKSGMLEEVDKTKCSMTKTVTQDEICPSQANPDELAAVLVKKTSSRKQLIKRREARSTAILGFILFGFIGCWLPFFTVYVWRAIPQFRELYPVAKEVFNVFFWLGYCNSALNPVIYATVNSEFRKAFKKLIFPRAKSHAYRL